MKKQVCIICGKPLNDGIIIYGKGICPCCEKRLMNMDRDTDFYEYYKECIRRNIAELVIREEEINCQNYRF
jgi:DNA-directed RNA polymerase subunit RPC12/RpoP